MSDPKIFWCNTINNKASKLSSGYQVVPVMSEYTKKERDEVNWYSDSFYTHHKGYKMHLYLYAASGTHLLVYLFFMKGPYEDQLRWPLNGHCEVKLNQISNSEQHLGNGKYQDLMEVFLGNKLKGIPQGMVTSLPTSDPT